MKKENQKYLLLLLLLGGGYFVYKKFASSEESPSEKEDDGKPINTGNAFDPIQAAKDDPEFKEYVIHLQQLLNIVLPQLNAKTIQVDGWLGNETMNAIVVVFGTRYLPIASKEAVKWLSGELEKMKTNVQYTPTTTSGTLPSDVVNKSRLEQARKIVSVTKIGSRYSWIDKQVTLPYYKKDLLGKYQKVGGVIIKPGSSLVVVQKPIIMNDGFIYLNTRLPSGNFFIHISPWSVTIY